jgi:hypothetical protein
MPLNSNLSNCNKFHLAATGLANMATIYRFASVDDDDGSDKSEMVFTPPGSDKSGPPDSGKEASPLMEGFMYELVNMFDVDDSYPDARVSREDASQYSNLF